ncbi:MAG: DUF1592 domain-containing protein [Myxococcota bacterium]
MDGAGSGGEATAAGEEGDGSDSDAETPELSCEDGTPGPRMLRLLTRTEYAQTVADLLAIPEPDVSTIPIEPEVEGYDNNAAASLVTARHVEAYLDLARLSASEAVDTNAAGLAGCMPEDDACARSFVESFGTRALRRPLSDDEVEHYLAQFDSEAAGGDFYEGMRMSIESMLASPAFLYRSEMGESVGAGLYRLTAWETASLLSYTFTGSMPDPELQAAAADGSLYEPEVRLEHARRLLDSPRGRARFTNFASQWLGTTSLLSANKDADAFPNFSDDIRIAMIEEEQRFIEHVVFDSEQTVEELFTADYTFVNDALANYYGLPAPGSSELVRVEVPEGFERGGLLTLGSFVTAHAHANETSPVGRGVTVRERIMCQPLAPPPPDVDATPPDVDPNATTRERYAQHSADPACAGCHVLIDPIGFGFEGFDGAGAFRTQENGMSVDQSGSVEALVEPDGSLSSVPFDGARELSRVLAANGKVQACVMEHYLHYVSGRDDLSEDECTLEELGARLDASGGNLHEAILEITQLEAFTLRSEFSE